MSVLLQDGKQALPQLVNEVAGGFRRHAEADNNAPFVYLSLGGDAVVPGYEANDESGSLGMDSRDMYFRDNHWLRCWQSTAVCDVVVHRPSMPPPLQHQFGSATLVSNQVKISSQFPDRHFRPVVGHPIEIDRHVCASGKLKENRLFRRPGSQQQRHIGKQRSGDFVAVETADEVIAHRFAFEAKPMQRASSRERHNGNVKHDCSPQARRAA